MEMRNEPFVRSPQAESLQNSATCLNDARHLSASPASSGTRDRIVAAAVNLLVNEGPAAFTVAAVARMAKVSKGGLLYHFPSQKKLSEEIVERSIAKLNRIAVAKTVLCTSGGSAVRLDGQFDAEIVAGLVLTFSTERALRVSLTRVWLRWDSSDPHGPQGSDFFSQAAIEQLAQWMLGPRQVRQLQD